MPTADTTATAATAVVAIQKIPLSQIVPSPFQTRKDFNPEELQGLAQSMKEHGVLNPVIVRPVSAGRGVRGAGEGSFNKGHLPPNSEPPTPHYELIAGERRVRAAKLLGWSGIDARVQDVDDQEAAQQVVVENLQRDDLNPIEMAAGYKKLADMGMKQTDIAREVGVSQAAIAQALALLDLPSEVQSFITRVIISPSQARLLQRIKDKEVLIQTAKQAASQGWSVKETERQVAAVLGKSTQPTKPTQQSKPTQPPLDPLSDLWPTLPPLSGETRLWAVSYGIQTLLGVPMDGWQFRVANQGAEPRKALRNWFLEMAKVLWAQSEQLEPASISEQPLAGSSGRAQSRADRSSASTPTDEIWTDRQIEQLKQQFKRARLPKTPAEHAELQRLAPQGPGAIFAWVYGKDSLLAQDNKNRTWADFMAPDPQTGLKELLSSLQPGG